MIMKIIKEEKLSQIQIREKQEDYMRSLKQWLAETKEDEPEEMSSFFTARIEGYEEHMKIWEKEYRLLAELLFQEIAFASSDADDTAKQIPQILDLGCGTGLELDAVWEKNVEIQVTGIDMCRTMLDKLVQKAGDKKLELVCADYFQYDLGMEKWDAVISFESLHHFLPEKKEQLYTKIYRALKESGIFLLGDYIACCEEEETLLRSAYMEKRKKSRIGEKEFVHFDIPLTIEHEAELLEKAGFKRLSVRESENATFLLAYR